MNIGIRRTDIISVIVLTFFVLGSFFILHKIRNIETVDIDSLNTGRVTENYAPVFVDKSQEGESSLVEEPSVSNVEVSEVTVGEDQEVELVEMVVSGVLPERINLPVPFTSQAPQKIWTQPWQDACEEAAVLMFDAYYKKYGISPLFARDELQRMVDWEDERSWGLSIPMIQLQELTEYYMGSSFKTEIIFDPTVEDIKKQLAANNPVMVVADGKTLANPHFRNGGPEYHVLVIRGYDGGSFITNDPGTQHGENFKYSFDNMMLSIHDWNDGNVPAGRPQVLVVKE